MQKRMLGRSEVASAARRGAIVKMAKRAEKMKRGFIGNEYEFAKLDVKAAIERKDV
jgi:hypothetical protein